MTAPIAPVGGAASASPFTAAAGGRLGKNEFLKLLVAQMTNQDPMNPMDGQQMAAQLAQFSSVEQLMNLGDKLDAQAGAVQAMLGVANNSAAVGLIGRTAMVATDEVYAGAGGTQSATVLVPAGGGAASLRVLDASGAELRSVSLGRLDGGTQAIDVAAALDGLPEGGYRIAVDVETADGAVPLATQVAVQVDGVQLSADGAFITAGPQFFPIGLISAIRAALPTS
jgi:flagellar basal-body rod modification protein FlgD